MRSLALLVTAALFVPLAAGAQEPKLLAVLPLDARDAHLDAPTQHVLEESIRTVAGNALLGSGYSVIPGDTTLAALPAPVPGAPEAPCGTTCATEAARKLHAQLFVSGTVQQAEGTYYAFVRLFETESGRQIGSADIQGAHIADLRQAFEAKAPALFAAAAPAPPAVTPPPTSPPPPPPPPPPSTIPPPPSAAPAAPGTPPPPPPPPPRDAFTTPDGYPRTLHFQLGEKFDRAYTLEVTNNDHVMSCVFPLNAKFGCDLRPATATPTKYVVLDGKKVLTHGIFRVPLPGLGLKLMNIGHPDWAVKPGSGLFWAGLAVTAIAGAAYYFGTQNQASTAKPSTATYVEEGGLAVGVLVLATGLILQGLHVPDLVYLQPKDTVLPPPPP